MYSILFIKIIFLILKIWEILSPVTKFMAPPLIMTSIDLRLKTLHSLEIVFNGNPRLFRMNSSEAFIGTTTPYDLNGTYFSTKTNGILDLEINKIKPNWIIKKRKIWFRMSPVQRTKWRWKKFGGVWIMFRWHVS